MNTTVGGWGGITAGDVATDLAAVWTLFDTQSARQRVLEIYAPDQMTLDCSKV
jgi:hypothetical protein